MRAFPDDVETVDDKGNTVADTSPVIFTPEEIAQMEREAK